MNYPVLNRAGSHSIVRQCSLHVVNYLMEIEALAESCQGHSMGVPWAEESKPYYVVSRSAVTFRISNPNRLPNLYRVNGVSTFQLIDLLSS